jgi:hypothetical protein
MGPKVSSNIPMGRLLLYVPEWTATHSSCFKSQFFLFLSYKTVLPPHSPCLPAVYNVDRLSQVSFFREVNINTPKGRKREEKERRKEFENTKTKISMQNLMQL